MPASARNAIDDRRYRAALLFVGVLTLTVPLIVGQAIYRRTYAQESEALRFELRSASDYRARHVSQWLESLKADAIAMSNSPYMSEAVDDLLSERTAQNLQAMRQRLRLEMQSGDLLDVVLVESNGTCVVGAVGAEPVIHAEEMQLVERAIGEETVVVDAHGQGQSSAHVAIAVPVLSANGARKPRAVVLERVALERELLCALDGGDDPALALEIALLQAQPPRTTLLTGTAGATDSSLSAWAETSDLEDWDEGEPHLLLTEERAPSDRSIALLTRVPDTEWMILSSMQPTTARVSAVRDVILSLGWSAASLLVVGGAAQMVFLPRRRARRKRQEVRDEERRLLNERLEFLLGGTGDAFLDLAPSLAVRHANHRAYALYGLSLQDMVGQPLERLVASEDARSMSLRLRALKPGEETTFDCVHEHADGSSFPVRCAARAAQEDGGVGYQLLVRSLSGSKGAQECSESYQDKLRGLAFDLARTDERERRRLATNLHDRVGQTLTLLRMQLGALESAEGEDAAQIARSACLSAERAIQETRTVTCDISPPVLYDLGLAPALDWLAEQFGNRFGLDVSVDHDGSPTPPSRDIRAALFRAVQELLMNVVKHSKATRATVVVRSDDERITIDVRDDGIGFDPDSLTRAQYSRGSFGLFSIGERLELMGGCMDIRSKPGCATIVRLDAPLWKGEGCNED